LFIGDDDFEGDNKSSEQIINPTRTTDYKTFQSIWWSMVKDSDDLMCAHLAWFKKIVLLSMALDKHGDDYRFFVWAAHSTTFNKAIGEEDFDTLLKRRALGFRYFRGEDQKINTNFLIFDLKYGGRELINDWMNMYRNLDVFLLNEWDDASSLDSINEYEKRDLTNHGFWDSIGSHIY
jgi:hypothetical protein